MTSPADAVVTEPDGRGTDAAGSPLSPWITLLLGAAAAVIGLLPWLIAGAQLPLQNLWATATLPGDMPFALLPFSQYALVLIAGLLITGAAVAGVTARALRARIGRPAFVALVAGLLVVQVAATVQTSLTVWAGLQQRGESALYLAALVAVASLSVLVGVLVLCLVARAPRAGALVGLSLAAAALAPWLGGLIVPFGSVPPDAVYPIVALVRWVPPALVGIAIAWAGIASVGRAVAAVFALVVVWIAPALITGISSAAGTRVLAKYPAEMLEYGIGVFRMAATVPELALPPLVVAIVVAAAGLGIRALRARTRRNVTPVETAPSDPAPDA